MKSTLLCATVLGALITGVAAGGAARGDAASQSPSDILRDSAAKINAAAEISFAATYTQVGASGKTVSYDVTGILAKPNVGEISVTTPKAAPPEIQAALLKSDGTTYSVVDPGKSQYLQAPVAKSGIDSDSTEASFFVYDVIGHPGVVAQNIADALLPADFDIGNDKVPPGIKRILTYSVSTVQLDGRPCTDVAQKLQGARHTEIFDTIVDSATGALVALVSYKDDTGTPQLDEKIVFTQMQLLPEKQAGIPFGYTPTAGMQPYHAAAATGTVASDFSVQRPDGSTVHLSDYKGKVVVIDFWATWCPPCLKTLPSTDKLAAQYQPQGVVFMPVCTWDSKARFDSWIPQHKDWTMSWLFDAAAEDTAKSIATTKYAVSGIPTQCVIGKDGVIVYRGFADSDAGEKPMVDAINKAMAAS